MSLQNCSFAGEINKIAASLDLSPSAAHIEMIEAVLQSEAIIADDGTVTADLGSGPIGIADAISEHLARLRLTRASESAPAPTSPTDHPGVLRVGNGVQHGRHDAFADIVRAFQAGQAAATAREISTWPNPWLSSQTNRTRQTVISNTNPALAAKLKAEAAQ